MKIWIPVTKEPASPSIKYSQFPVTLALASTIHGSKPSLEWHVIDFINKKQRIHPKVLLTVNMDRLAN